MRHQDKTYNFVLSYTAKHKAFIRKVEVSRKTVYSGAACAVLLLASFAVLLTALPGANALWALNSGSELPATDSAEHRDTTGSESVAFLDYSRPSTSFEFAQNSGGPFDSTFQLTAVDTEREKTEIEKRLRLIETNANPKFLPTIWAHLGKINNEFGFRRNPFGGRSYEFHAGMDIDGERGDIIIAPANGIILKAGWQGGYGYMIEIDHGNGLTTRYGHLSKLGVKEGDPIQRGQLIGFVGSTGRSTGPHLHYELRLDEKPINPRRFLPPEPTEI